MRGGNNNIPVEGDFRQPTLSQISTLVSRLYERLKIGDIFLIYTPRSEMLHEHLF